MTLKEWLTSKDKPYDKGLELLQQIGASSTLINVLKSSQNSLNKQKLKEKLQEFYSNSTPKTSPVKESKPFEAETKKHPEEIAHVYSTKIGAFKKMAALHQELIHISGDSEKAIASRYKLQTEILRLDELNESCWDLIHYYEKHGKLPPDNTQFSPGALTIRELVNLEKTIPSYITKFNKELGLGSITEERRQDLEKRKTDWLLKSQLIKTELDNLPALSQIKEGLCLLS
jgi:hypothetical protein